MHKVRKKCRRDGRKQLKCFMVWYSQIQNAFKCCKKEWEDYKELKASLSQHFVECVAGLKCKWSWWKEKEKEKKVHEMSWIHAISKETKVKQSLYFLSSLTLLEKHSDININMPLHNYCAVAGSAQNGPFPFRRWWPAIWSLNINIWM